MQQGRALVLSSAQQQQLAPSSRGGGGQQLAGGSRLLAHSMESHVAGLEKSLQAEGAPHVCASRAQRSLDTRGEGDARHSGWEGLTRSLWSCVSCLFVPGAHIHTLQEAIKDVRGKVFSVQDVVVQSRVKLMRQEEATQAEASRAEIQIQLLAERQRLVEEVSTEHQLLLAAETALLNEEAEHTAVFLRNLAANEALIRGLHSLAPPPGSDPQPLVRMPDVSSQLAAVQKEIADVRRRVACLVLLSAD
jgi:hypothetical protein